MAYNPNAVQATSPLFSAVDNVTGLPLAGGMLYTYASGTTTPQATYTDNTLTTQMPNPIILDNYGQAVFWMSNLAYRFNLLNSAGVQQAHYPIDNVSPDNASFILSLSSYSTTSQGQGLVGFNSALSYPANTLPNALASTSSTSQGQGLIGFNSTLSYPANTLPNALASTSAGQGDALITVLQPFSGAVATTQNAVNARTASVMDFGAKGDGVTDDSAAFQAAINWAASLSVFMTGGARVYIPRNSYLINSTLTVSTTAQNLIIEGDGMSVSTLLNGVVGPSGTEPLIKFLSYGNRNVLRNLSIIGNAVIGAGGNGHAVALYDNRGTAGVTTWANSQMLIENVGINGHEGFGKDVSGATIPASGIYVFAALDLTIRRVSVYTCKIGMSLNTCGKCNVYDYVSDQCVNNCIYLLNNSEGIDLFGAALNGSGSGGTTDGLFYANNNIKVASFGGRWKNGNPNVVNLLGQVNEQISFNGIALAQLDNTSGKIIATFGTLSDAVKFRDCAFTLDTTIVSGVCVDIVQDGTGQSCISPEITGCKFTIGDGGTMLAGIRLNNTTNYVRSGKFDGNTFGKNGNATVATIYTDCIVATGNYEGCSFFNNIFSATSNVTMTNTLHLSGSSTNCVLGGNVYEVNGGTITNKLNASGQYLNVLTDGTNANGLFKPWYMGLAGTSKTNNGATTTYTLTAGYSYNYIQTSAASLALTFPAADPSIDGAIYTVVLSAGVATLTWSSSGATFLGAPAAGVANVVYRFIYKHSALNWMPC
jgi:hypothetical protein